MIYTVYNIRLFCSCLQIICFYLVLVKISRNLKLSLRIEEITQNHKLSHKLLHLSEVVFCVSVLTAQGLCIQQKNAMASAVSTVPVNSVMVSAPITIKKKHAASRPWNLSVFGITFLGCPARSKDGLRVIASFLINLPVVGVAWGRFVSPTLIK